MLEIQMYKLPLICVHKTTLKSGIAKASDDGLPLPHGCKTTVYFTLHFIDTVTSSNLYYILEQASPSRI